MTVLHKTIVINKVIIFCISMSMGANDANIRDENRMVAHRHLTLQDRKKSHSTQNSHAKIL